MPKSVISILPLIILASIAHADNFSDITATAEVAIKGLLTCKATVDSTSFPRRQRLNVQIRREI